MSHPTWVCGLKLSITLSALSHTSVTPYVGVWIETMRGNTSENWRIVTPYVGVWIETAITIAHLRGKGVTPYVGVWVETLQGDL